MRFQQYKNLILDTARKSIAYTLEHHKPIMQGHENIPAPMLENGACFVTLEINHQLRGCIGNLEATQPLIDSISQNAYAAAFSDPRFPAVTQQEFDALDIHVSILTPATEMVFTDEQDLVNQIMPNIDGLILEDKGQRGTFLPSVWESLPAPDDFLRHLKLKAGLPENYWSDTLKVFRYHTEMIKE